MEDCGVGIGGGVLSEDCLLVEAGAGVDAEVEELACVSSELNFDVEVELDPKIESCTDEIVALELVDVLVISPDSRRVFWSLSIDCMAA